MTIKFYSIVLILLLIASSCCNQSYVDPDTLADYSFDTTSYGDFQAGQWPDNRWWEQFGSEDLSALIEMALDENPTFHSAQKRVLQAQELALATRSKLFPTASMTLNDDWVIYSPHGLFRGLFPAFPATTNLLNVLFSFVYEFDFWGKNRNLYYAQVSMARAKIAEAHQAILVIATSVAAAYFDYQTQLALLPLYEESLLLQEALIQLQKERYELGLDSKQNYLTAKEVAVEIKSAIEMIKNQMETDRHVLATLSGQSPDTLMELAVYELREQPLELPTNLSADLMARRPDLMARIHMLDSYVGQVKVAKTGYYPNVNLMGMVGLQSLQLHNLFSADSYQAELTPGLTLPIFTAGNIRATIHSAEARYDEAVQDYRHNLLTAIQEIADQISTLQTVIKQQKLNDESIALYKEQELLDKALFDSGLRKWDLVLQAKRNLLQQKYQKIALLSKRLLTTIQLIKALGGGYETNG